MARCGAEWPGGFPRRLETIARLVDRGAALDAPFVGPHAERPLHWAASCDDVEVIDLLLDRGADIEAPGSVFANGAALAGAVAFGQWRAVRTAIGSASTASRRWPPRSAATPRTSSRGSVD